MVTLVILRFVIDFFKPENILNFDVLKSIVGVMFTIWALFLRQSANSKHLSSWIMASLLFASLALLVQYEVHVMENLVAPFQKFRTLAEFLFKGYTLVYESEEWPGVYSPRTRLQWEFNEMSLGQFPHDKTIVIM